MTGRRYQQLQSTRPQSLGYGLVDSPVALASWILEKLWSWSDHQGDVTECFSYDQILDNVMLYWLSASGTSSARLYWEDSHGRAGPGLATGIGTSGMFDLSKRAGADVASVGRAAISATSVTSDELDRGGHFAAFEQPTLFVEEVRACFRTMR